MAMSKRAKQLSGTIIKHLDESVAVRVNVEEYGKAAGISLRSAQRTIEMLENSDAFDYGDRIDGVQYFTRSGVSMYELEQDKITWITANLSFLSFVSPLYIYIYNKGNKSNDIDTSSDPKDLYRTRTKESDDKNDKNDKNDISANNNGAVVADFPDNEYATLLAMVCSVCNKNEMLLMDEQERLIDKLFKAGVTSNELYTYFHKQSRPNFWQFHWKGQRGSAPSIKDLLDFYEDAKAWKPSYFHTLPGYMKIVEDFEELQRKYGPRMGKSGMNALADLGYGPLFERMGLDWYSLSMQSTGKNRHLIKTTLSEMRTELEAVAT